MSLKTRSHASPRFGGLFGQRQTQSRLATRSALIAALLLPCAYATAQTSATASTAAATAKDDEVVVLTPFEVSADATKGYNATTTLAGNRLNTDLRDVGSSVTVYTSQFLKDLGATNNSSLLQYTVSSEVGGIYGNFAGTGDGAALSEPDRPNQTTRVRGLAAADNTRDFFLSQIPWDGYNIERVDLQRGPNAILFGEGSPAGIINAGTKSAAFKKNGGEAEVRVGSYGSTRESLGYNQVILPKQFAVRFDLLNDNEKYEQKQAYSRDRRASGALRFEPEALNRNGYRFIVKAGFETGRIESNNPRELPPQDQITPFFGTGNAGTNQATYNGWQLWDHVTGRIGNGALRDPKGTVYANAGGMVIPYIQYWLSTSPGGNNPVALFGNSGGAQTGYWVQSASNAFTKNTIGGLVTQPGSWATIANTALWATNANLDYSAAGVFKNNLITDPSIFNFYKNLIDGDTKHDTQQFHRWTVNVAETALDDQVGISFDYNKESFKYTHTALLGGTVSLFIDPMSVYNNGTPNAGLTGVPFSDGTPNPNVGRPFVSTTGGTNYSNEVKSEDKRVTAFVSRDLRKDLNGWAGRILGKHTVTGLWADSIQTTDNRNWNSYGYLDPNAYTLQDNPPLNPALTNFTSVTPTMDIYLGPSLLGKSAKGANIPGVSGIPAIANGAVTYFNDTWNAPTVDPNAQWTNNAFTLDPAKLAPGYVAAAGGTIVNGMATGIISPNSFKQSDNPANYVGWTTKNLNITQAGDSPANRDALTTNAALNQAETTSKALVWQGKMLDNSLVATFGWRTDTAKSYGYSRTIGNGSDLHAIDFSNYSIPNSANAVISVSSRSESLVAHVMDLPGLKEALKNVPFEISLSYNQSSNFQPIAGRFDVLNQAIAPPSGKTIDRGILIETRDGKYSLKVSKYVTSEKNITNASSGSFGYHFGWWMNQLGYFTNRYDRSLTSYDGTSKSGAYSSLINYTNPDGSENTGYLAIEDAAVAGVRAFQNAIDPRFWKAWGYTSLAQVQSGAPYSQNVAVPNGFTLTEDSISKGYEIELNANPIPNWRITFNVSKESAVRSNIGGEAMSKIMSQALAMVQGPGGMMHFWWGTPDVPYAKDTFYLGDFHTFSGPGTDFAGLKVLEGAAAPELRTWRYNLVTNYDFTRSFLKGVNVGGGMRYESGATIGFPVIGNPNSPATDSYDVAHPYKGPSETYFDAWIGYSRKLTSKINWHVQLNATNLFKHDYLIPITVQGPIPGQAAGTPAGYRIGPTQRLQLTSRFEF